MGGRRARATMALALVLMAIGGTAGTAIAAPSFTASNISSPPSGAELFYSGDTGSGYLALRGNVTQTGSLIRGDLYCYTASDSSAIKVASGIDVSSGSFASNVSLAPIAGQACRLRMVPAGTLPTGAATAPFTGPAISVSDQYTHSSNGNEYGYYVLSGGLAYSFALRSLGECPVNASYATDPTTLGSFQLLAGNACLPASSGIAPNPGSRSALQVDGLNAYPPGAISSLAGESGFEPLDYTATYAANHDGVTINESEIPTVCAPPGGYPPTPAICPSLRDSGIAVQQTTTLLPGGQVVRVAQRFSSVDGHPHALDLLFGQSVTAPATGEVPGFEFPGQLQFAGHATPDSFSLFPPGASSIIVLGDAAAAPGTANPIGAITYDTPPKDADFLSATGAQLATMALHYTAAIPAGGSVTYNWSFTQATSASDLQRLEATERDRFSHPLLRLLAPRRRLRTHKPTLTVRGTASDPIGIGSLTLDGRPVALDTTGHFQRVLALSRGVNLITVTVTNLGGNHQTVSRRVVYTPTACRVPRLRGRLVATARRILHNYGCRAGRVRRVRSRRIRRGLVISSTARAGSVLALNARVGLVVSRGA